MNRRAIALPDWPRAHGVPVVTGALRTMSADFQVDEELGFEPSGDGEHDLLHVEKTDANTSWVATRLAEFAAVREVDVGYCGLKDRHAVTTQYFSVRRPSRVGTDWSGFRAEGVRILGQARHYRKLKTGSHAANRFAIVLRGPDLAPQAAALAARWAVVTAQGVPNYFGEQRFGRDGGNLALARDVFGGRRVRRAQLGLAYSTARALLFNHILAARVVAGSWNQLLAGELANLDGSRSVFAVDDVTPDLARRCGDFDLHPSGTLWGDGAPLSRLIVAELERDAIADNPAFATGLERARVEAGSRPLRVRPSTASLSVDAGSARFEFRLPPGSFATAVLREVSVQADQASLSNT
jgi:tRNA pseudouridine13 synthase